jgi:hypothetical protein
MSPESERLYNLRVLAARDEEFADFVFAHFGGYWTRNEGYPDRTMRCLPKRIEALVNARARAFEIERGGP